MTKFAALLFLFAVSLSGCFTTNHIHNTPELLSEGKGNATNYKSHNATAKSGTNSAE